MDCEVHIYVCARSWCIIIIVIIFWPWYSIFREWKNYAMQYKKVQKSSWNEPYSSSSFTKQSCSKMALYRWIKTDSRCYYYLFLIFISIVIINKYYYSGVETKKL